MKPLIRLFTNACLLALLAGCSSAPGALADCEAVLTGKPFPERTVPGLLPRDFDSISAAPRRNAERESTVRSLLGEVCPDVMSSQIQGYASHNYWCVIPGLMRAQILVAAHYDRVGRGQGVADNWTGVVSTLRLLAHFRDNLPTHTLVFVLFGEEEPGTIGSRQFVRASDIADVRAMVNIDTLGLGPATIDRRSDPQLACMAFSAAESLGISVRTNKLHESTGDWRPFHRAGVPVLNLHSLDRAGLNIVHSRRDRAENINLAQVDDVHRMALRTLQHLDAQ